MVVCRCPPGHGDVYPSLLGSGFLDRLLSKGVKYLFVSNSDNLGATLSVDLLAYFAKTDKAFLMEVSLIVRGSVIKWERPQGEQLCVVGIAGISHRRREDGLKM